MEYTGDRLKNVQVSRIYEHSVCTKEGFWESEEVNEEDLRPILLTSDIFKQVKEQLENMSLYRVMSMIKYEIYFMRYVHELQHLLKQCKIKKEIVL